MRVDAEQRAHLPVGEQQPQQNLERLLRGGQLQAPRGVLALEVGDHERAGAVAPGGGEDPAQLRVACGLGDGGAVDGDRALAEQQREDVAAEAAQDLGGRRVGGERVGEPGVHRRRLAADECLEQALAVAEEPVDGLLRRARGGGDGEHGRAGDAALAQAGQRRVEDRVAAGGLVGGAAAGPAARRARGCAGHRPAAFAALVAAWGLRPAAASGPATTPLVVSL